MAAATAAPVTMYGKSGTKARAAVVANFAKAGTAAPVIAPASMVIEADASGGIVFSSVSLIPMLSIDCLNSTR